MPIPGVGNEPLDPGRGLFYFGLPITVASNNPFRIQVRR